MQDDLFVHLNEMLTNENSKSVHAGQGHYCRQELCIIVDIPGHACMGSHMG